MTAAVPPDRVVAVVDEGQVSTPISLGLSNSDLATELPDLREYPQQLSVLPIDEDC